jgi:quinolinate synthase
VSIVFKGTMKGLIRQMQTHELKNEIMRIKKEKNALIVAHNYQIDDVQNIADKVGDSFYLSKLCATNSAKLIVFCGVRFMAESAKILSPEKTVLLPELKAGCPMADSITADDVTMLKRKHPKAVIVCYINTTAEVKAECDICCTSSNAIKIVTSIPQKDIIFLPDRNLGSYIAKQVPEKNFILYDGCCITHNRFGLKEVEVARQLYPDAPIAVHPECPPEVVEAADFVGSTSEILEYCKKSDKKQIVIGTEMGILHTLKADSPNKKFMLLTPRLVCSNMKLTTLTSVYNALNENKNIIEVDEDIRVRARTCLQRMLDIVG